MSEATLKRLADKALRQAEHDRMFDEALLRTEAMAQRLAERTLQVEDDDTLARLASPARALQAEVMDRTRRPDEAEAGGLTIQVVNALPE